MGATEPYASRDYVLGLIMKPLNEKHTQEEIDVLSKAMSDEDYEISKRALNKVSAYYNYGSYRNEGVSSCLIGLSHYELQKLVNSRNNETCGACKIHYSANGVGNPAQNGFVGGDSDGVIPAKTITDVYNAFRVISTFFENVHIDFDFSIAGDEAVNDVAISEGDRLVKTPGEAMKLKICVRKRKSCVCRKMKNIDKILV
jgi:hypothetical protein